MRDTGIFIFSMLALVGLCTIVGMVTRGKIDPHDDKDDMFSTLFRGFGTVLVAFVALSAIATVLYILYLPFS